MTMKVEVAKLFSTLGFDIDTAQLEKFENLTRTMRASTVKLARDLRVMNSQLTTASSKLKSVNGSLDSVASRKGVGGLATGYANLTKNVNVTQSALNRYSNLISVVDPKLVQQDERIDKLAISWDNLSSKIREANNLLHQNKNIGAVGGRVPSTRVQGGTNTPSQPRGQSGGAGGVLAGGLAARFMSSMSPAAALAGGAVTAGFAVKETVKMGREWIKMNNVLIASTENTEQFQNALNFTRNTTRELGTDVNEFGLAYAKILQASKGKLDVGQTQEIFRNFSELSVVLGSTADDQKGIFRAISQMFSKGKIQMEEINQLAERQVPALSMLTRAYKELGMTQAEFEKAQREGKLDPTKFMPLMAKYAKEFANNQDALKKALEGSTAQQGRFMNKVKETAGALAEAGLDKLIGDLFKGLGALVDVLKPAAIWLVKATQGFVDLTKAIANFAKEHPVITAALVGIVALLVANSRASRGAGSAFNQLVTAVILGSGKIKSALLRTGILAILVGIGTVLASLSDHMNGKNNWISVMIAGLELLGSEIRVVWSEFTSVLTAMKNAFGNSEFMKFVDRFWGGATNLKPFAKETQVQPNDPNKWKNQTTARPNQTLQEAVKTLPNGGGDSRMFTLQNNYTLKLENGKQVITKVGGQKLDLGGLGK